MHRRWTRNDRHGGWTREGPGSPVDNDERARIQRAAVGPKGFPGPLPRTVLTSRSKGRPLTLPERTGRQSRPVVSSVLVHKDIHSGPQRADGASAVRRRLGRAHNPQVPVDDVVGRPAARQATNPPSTCCHRPGLSARPRAMRHRPTALPAHTDAGRLVSKVAVSTDIRTGSGIPILTRRQARRTCPGLNAREEHSVLRAGPSRLGGVRRTGPGWVSQESPCHAAFGSSGIPIK